MFGRLPAPCPHARGIKFRLGGARAVYELLKAPSGRQEGPGTSHRALNAPHVAQDCSIVAILLTVLGPSPCTQHT